MQAHAHSCRPVRRRQRPLVPLSMLPLAIVTAVVFILWLLNRPSSPDLPSTTIVVKAPVIAPELDRLPEYRTSQLVRIGDRAILGRHLRYLYAGRSTPKGVIVLGLDAQQSLEHLEALLEERKAYARQHGYALFCRYIQDVAPYDVPAATAIAMARFALMRQALATYPKSEWAWYLDDLAVITNPSQPLNWLAPDKLENHMLRGVPLALPAAQVKSHKRTSASKASLIVTRTDFGISTRSFVVRNNLMAKAFLELAMDPLNVRYPPHSKVPEPAGAVATHIALWHPAFLRALAIVPPQLLGTSEKEGKVGQLYHSGDMVRLVENEAEWTQLRSDLL